MYKEPLERSLNPLCRASSAGHVTWDEYRAKFLASKGFNEKEVAEKIKNNEDLKLDEESEWRKCVFVTFQSCLFVDAVTMLVLWMQPRRCWRV